MSFEKGLIRCCDQRCVDSREDVAGRFIKERKVFLKGYFVDLFVVVSGIKRERER